MNVVIHTNLWLPSQLESAQWVADGFKQHGIDAEITGNKHKAADVHVVQGPWYCFDHWRERSDTHHVLWLNRCYYGDARFDLSIGWLRPDGSRDFRNDGVAAGKGTLPELKEPKDGRRCAVVFGDYGEDSRQAVEDARQTYDSVFFRPHPRHPQRTAVMTLSGPLEACWALGDVAIGSRSTVLVQAEIEGLHVVCSDPLHVVHHDGDREAWLKRLSWANWHFDEITSGAMWEHLKCR